MDDRDNRPDIACVCGSTRFKDEYLELHKQLTLAGIVYVSVGFFGHQERIEPTPIEKAVLDALHMYKVQMSDYLVIVDIDGYIGESTAKEIEYGKLLGKQVYYWSNEDELFFKHTLDMAGRKGIVSETPF